MFSLPIWLFPEENKNPCAFLRGGKPLEILFSVELAIKGIIASSQKVNIFWVICSVIMLICFMPPPFSCYLMSLGVWGGVRTASFHKILNLKLFARLVSLAFAPESLEMIFIYCLTYCLCCVKIKYIYHWMEVFFHNLVISVYCFNFLHLHFLVHLFISLRFW